MLLRLAVIAAVLIAFAPAAAAKDDQDFDRKRAERCMKDEQCRRELKNAMRAKLDEIFRQERFQHEPEKKKPKPKPHHSSHAYPWFDY